MSQRSVSTQRDERSNSAIDESQVGQTGPGSVSDPSGSRDPPLTVNPSGVHLGHKHGGLGPRGPAGPTGGPGLMGDVAVDNGLTVPDVAVGVGGAMAAGVGQQDVIVQGAAAAETDTVRGQKTRRSLERPRKTSFYPNHHSSVV